MSLMNDAFHNHLDKFVIVYLDDILIYRPDLETHISHLRLVLELLRQNQLYANLSKCIFCQRSVEFLGHVIYSDGFSMEAAKVKAIST
jgi:recombinational DNA repair protein (RecF pathway)